MAVDGLDSWSESFGRVSHSHAVYNRATATRTVTATAPDGSYAVTLYQGGQLDAITQYDADDTQLGQVTYTYDAHGRQATITDARTGATTFTYTDADQVVTVTSPDPDDAGPQSAQTTSYTYDSRGRTSQVTLPDGGDVHTTYWPTGELRQTWGARVYPTESAYDAQGRLQTLTTWKDFSGDTGAAVTTWSYDAERGWLNAKTYADGKGPQYTYTDAGRLQTRTWARLAALPTPGSPLVTTHSYNDAGNLTGIDYSDATPDVTVAYDRAGRPVTTVDAAGTQTLAYAADGQLDTATYAAGGLLGGVSVDYGFDAFGRRTSATASAATTISTTAYTYGAASRLATVSSGTDSFAYTYLPDSDLVATVTANNGTADIMTTAKTYDHLSRLTGIASARLAAPADTLTSFTYAYNAANQRIRSTLADGSYWLYEYDALGQITFAGKYWSTGVRVAGQSFGYAFDDIGNRKTAMEGDPPWAAAETSGYSANALNQYTQRTVPGVVTIRGEAEAAATVTVTVGAPPPAGTTYPTDRQGRGFRALVPVDNATSAVWQDLQIVGVRPGAGPDGKDIVSEQTGHAFVPETPEAFVHDDDGNLLSDGRWQYTWDAENRLAAMETRADLPAAVPRLRLEFAYDSQSRRIAKKVFAWDGLTSAFSLQLSSLFIYDGWLLLAEVDATGAPLRSYLWGLDLSGSLQGAGGIGGLLCVNVGGAVPAANLPCYDGNGNLVALADSVTGALTAQYEYDPFGNPLRVTGVAAGANPFRFSTKYTDAETGLVYYGYRYLSTEKGRWLSRDPLDEGGGENLYGHCGNGPVGTVDPLGLTVALREGQFSDTSLPALLRADSSFRAFYAEARRVTGLSELPVLFTAGFYESVFAATRRTVRSGHEWGFEFSDIGTLFEPHSTHQPTSMHISPDGIGFFHAQPQPAALPGEPYPMASWTDSGMTYHKWSTSKREWKRTHPGRTVTDLVNTPSAEQGQKGGGDIPKLNSFVEYEGNQHRPAGLRAAIGFLTRWVCYGDQAALSLTWYDATWVANASTAASTGVVLVPGKDWLRRARNAPLPSEIREYLQR